MESRSEKNQDIAEEIEKEERKDKNKKLFKILFWTFLPLFIFFAVSYTLLRYVGNMGLIVREYPVYIDNLSYEINGLKVVQFSDLHFNQYTSFDKVDKLVNAINKANPDIVIFTGDLIDKDYIIDNETKEKLIEELNKIDAKIGKYAIYGDEDGSNFKDVFDNINFEILDNEITNIYIGSSVIHLVAVDTKYKSEDMPTLDDNNVIIAICHKPDLADRIIEDFHPNMILAGHSLNGQVILPLIGPVVKKDGAKKYISSYYEIDNTLLFISGGIGNSNYQFRLLNHPSINFYRLRTK
jgi:hypothetical protein